MKCSARLVAVESGSACSRVRFGAIFAHSEHIHVVNTHFAERHRQRTALKQRNSADMKKLQKRADCRCKTQSEAFVNCSFERCRQFRIQIRSSFDEFDAQREHMHIKQAEARIGSHVAVKLAAHAKITCSRV